MAGGHATHTLTPTSRSFLSASLLHRDRDSDVVAAVDRAVRGAVAAVGHHRQLTAAGVVGGGVVGGDEAAGRVVGGLPLLHPLDGRGRAAGDARAPRHRLPRRVLQAKHHDYSAHRPSPELN